MAGNGRESEPNEIRLRRLFWRAVAFSIAVPLALLFPVASAFNQPPVIALLALGVIVPTLLLVNYLTVRAMHRRQAPPTTPWPRVALTVIVAAFLCFAAVLWIYHDAIAAARVPTERDTWTVETQALQAERAAKHDITTRQAPSVENDPDVIDLKEQLRAAEEELVNAEQERLGELDGTRGTGTPGRGDAYNEKERYRDEVRQRVADLSAKLEAAKAEAKARIEQLAGEQQAARQRIAEIDKRLETLGPTRPPEPDLFDAWWSVVQQRPYQTLGVAAGSGVGYLAVDWLAMLVVVRRVCRPHGWLDEPVTEALNRHRARDDRRIRGAKRPRELPAHMQRRYFPHIWRKHRPRKAEE
ncbi:MAG TPA: DUF4407 domain-containing protein [Actinophytocola sp.]|uniref:DUF4407 domain-containing protein n=1 Tax=Actinophytocola sp. TaxID=1872138 RepID=UPI002DDD9333|nr:DUF4407 domain-containing protein [Actinophytocola sp.]HEV2781155.1 DUF4407 domain-containing protein [Actinophytocola sp.]